MNGLCGRDGWAPRSFGAGLCAPGNKDTGACPTFCGWKNVASYSSSGESPRGAARPAVLTDSEQRDTQRKSPSMENDVEL